MAIQINPNLYTGGNVRFDTTPTLNTIAKLEAQKRAKDEALNQYFNDLTGKINTAGVRQQDLNDPKYGGIQKMIDDWKSTWLANKEQIKKGGLAQQEYLNQYQKILRSIDQSKNRAKFELELGKAKMEGKYDPDDDDIGVLSKVGKSIFDPESYKEDKVSEYGFGDLSPAVPEFDADRQMKFWNSATKGATPGKKYNYEKAYTNPKTQQVIVPFEISYSPEQVKAIADNARDSAKNDRSARKFYNKVLNEPQSARWQELNKAYQGVYGEKDMVDTPEKAAAADAILRAQQSKQVGEEQELNRQAQNQFRIFLKGAGGGDSPKQPDPIDLTEYPDTADGGKDITALMQGVDVVSLVTGKKFAAKKVIYNPNNGRVTLVDPVNNTPEEMSLTTFLQNIKPQNPAQDIKFLQGLRNAKTGRRNQPQPKPQSKDPLNLGL